MNLLPNNWTYAKVSDFAELLRGISYKKDESRKESQKGYKPILRSNNINYELNFVDLVYVPEKKIKSIQFIREGDIIFAMSSGSKHLVGKSAQSKSSYDGSYGAFCGLLRVSNLMNKKYVGLFFKSQEYRKYISGISKGTNINNLKRDHVLEINFPLAPLNEQNHIIEKIEELFSDLDKATEDLKKSQVQLKIYRQSVLKAAFEGKLTEEWRKKNMLLMPPDNLRKEIGVGVSELNYSYIKNIPQKWILTKINIICNVVRGGSPRPMGDPKYFNGNIPFIKIGDITKLSSKYVLNSKTKVNEQGTKKSRLLSKGSLILSNSGTICIPKFLGVDACIHDGFVSFKDLPEYIDVNFLFEFFNYIRPYVIQKNKQGVTQVNLNTEIEGDIDLLIPAKEEQEQIVQEIESRLSVCDKLEETVQQSLEKIEYLRQSILKKAFEGKLVPQDPNGELAEKLLERIKHEKEKFESNNKKRKKR